MLAQGEPVMTEVATTDGRPRRLVTATALAAHFGVTQQYVAKLTADGVIEKRIGGYDQDACRLAYLKSLRKARRSTRTKADADHVAG
jgi:hypothetical protein